MKKNKLNISIRFLIFSVLAFGLTACGEGDSGAAKASHNVSVTLTGLEGDRVLVSLNDVEFTLTTNQSFTFDLKIIDGASYSVIVVTQPSNPIQLCTVTNGSGTISGTSVNNIEITCGAETTWYKDADADTFGDPATEVIGDQPDNTYVNNGNDCNDNNNAISPSATEAADLVDND